MLSLFGPETSCTRYRWETSCSHLSMDLGLMGAPLPPAPFPLSDSSSWSRCSGRGDACTPEPAPPLEAVPEMPVTSRS